MTNLNLYLLLRQISQNRSDIKLLNVYKGLPISYDVQVNSVRDAEIQVHSNRYQLACLYYQGETHLQVAELPFIIRSDVISLHLGKDDAVLGNFMVEQSSIGNRTQIRVEPHEPLVAVLHFSGASSEFFALLADISADGAGVYFEDYMFPARLCQPGAEISMTISLPDLALIKTKTLSTKPLIESRGIKSLSRAMPSKGQDGSVVITTQGKVVSVHPDAQRNRVRVGLRLRFRDLARAAILQYISQRQSEIIRDLSILSDELYSRKKQ